MMAELESLVASKEFIGKELSHGGKTYKVKHGDNFNFTDLVDGSVATKQVCCLFIHCLFPMFVNVLFCINLHNFC